MFLQEAPPDTTGYLIFGYAVIFGTLLVYLASFLVRRRNLEQDLETLRDLDDE